MELLDMGTTSVQPEILRAWKKMLLYTGQQYAAEMKLVRKIGKENI
jgi:hypothetical protein